MRKIAMVYFWCLIGVAAVGATMGAVVFVFAMAMRVAPLLVLGGLLVMSVISLAKYSDREDAKKEQSQSCN